MQPVALDAGARGDHPRVDGKEKRSDQRDPWSPASAREPVEGSSGGPSGQHGHDSPRPLQADAGCSVEKRHGGARERVKRVREGLMEISSSEGLCDPHELRPIVEEDLLREPHYGSDPDGQGNDESDRAEKATLPPHRRRGLRLSHTSPPGRHARIRTSARLYRYRKWFRGTTSGDPFPES